MKRYKIKHVFYVKYGESANIGYKIVGAESEMEARRKADIHPDLILSVELLQE